MVHPDIELRFINETVGYGLVARRLIPRGSITWARDRLDRTFTSDEIDAMPRVLQAVVGQVHVHRPTGLSHLLGHLAVHEPLVRAVIAAHGWDFEVAVRDIHPGEELTDDYATLNIERPFECECGASECRATILPDDLVRHHARWDAQVRAVFPLLATVEQPLLHLVNERDDVLRAIEDPQLVPSCLALYAGGICR